MPLRRGLLGAFLLALLAVAPAAADFSPDGRLLAIPAGSAVHIWNAATRTLSATLPVASGRQAESVQFARDGHTLLIREALHEGHQVALWDVRGPRLLRRLGEKHVAFVRSVLTPQARTVITYSLDGETLDAWDVATGRVLWQAHVGAGLGILDDEGRYLALRSLGMDDAPLAIWDVAGRRRARLLKESVNPACFSPNARRLAVWRGDSLGRRIRDGTVAVLDVPGGAPTDAAILCEPRAFSFDPEGRFLVVSTPEVALTAEREATLLAVYDCGRRALLWRSDARQGPLPLSRSSPASLAVSRDARMLAVSTLPDNSQAMLCDLRSGRVLHTLPAPGPIASLQFSPDGAVLVGVCGGSPVWWNTASGMPEK